MLVSFAVLLILFGLYYCWFVLRAWRGLRRLDSQPVSDVRPFVTVVVPARNEEQNIIRCLHALKHQEYPAELCEFIVVDDGSEDRTALLVKSFAATEKRFRLLQLGANTMDHPTTKRGRKPEAIALAVAAAKGDVVLLTDADCEPRTTWINSMLRFFAKDVAFVAGPVVEARRPELFARLRALDFFGFTVTTAGRIGIHSPVNSNGANVAFRKEFFSATGGFDYAAIKSDEETLMHRIHNQGLGRVAFAATPEAIVTTFPDISIKSFWRQRLRWGEMQGRYEKKLLLIELAGVYLAFVLWMAGVIVSVMEPLVLIPVATFFFLKVIVDWITMKCGADMLKESLRVADVVIAELLHIPYITIVTAAAQIVPFEWKGRTVVKWQT